MYTRNLILMKKSRYTEIDLMFFTEIQGNSEHALNLL